MASRTASISTIYIKREEMRAHANPVKNKEKQKQKKEEKIT
jgi:hypothetical protein